MQHTWVTTMALKINDTIRATRVGGKRPLSAIRAIVFHYTANTGLHATALGNARYFANGSEGRAASAHFVVDEGDTVYQCVPLDVVAWAVGDGRSGKFGKVYSNYNTVSIEMVSHTDASGKYYIPEATMRNAARLYQMLLKQLPGVQAAIRHYDISMKLCLPTDTTELLTRDGWKNITSVSVGEDVMTFNTDDGTATFSPVMDVVEPYDAEVVDCRGFEATTNHRLWAKPNCANSHDFRETTYGHILDGKKQYVIPTSARYTAPGLPLTDDQIQLLVWVQGDGHYMKKKNGESSGLEFHLKKKRKIDRVKEVLDANLMSYTECFKADGSVSIRIYDKSVVDWCEQWLRNKEFTYQFVDMDQGQFSIFAEEILDVDGCRAANCYTSTSANNLDIVQAIAATHGVRSHIGPLGGGKDTAVHFSVSNRVIGKLMCDTTTRDTEVSCVSVESGYILIRQKKDTFIVGNCPLPLIDEKKWADFKKLLEEVDEVVTKAKMIVDGKDVEVERILKDGTNYIKIRDIAKALDLDVSNKGNIPILNHKQ